MPEVKARRLPLLLLGLLLSAGLARLGLWQLQRGDEKAAMLAGVQAVLAERRPLPLAQAARPAGYTWAAGRGHFLPGPVLLLDNQRRGDAVGVQVLAPFQPQSGPPLLVELGWLALPPPASGIALGPDHVAQGLNWLLSRVDLPALRAASGLPLAARVLRLDPALPIGFARDLDVLPNTLPPERHRGYALQWFGLSATLLAITVFLFVRRRP